MASTPALITLPPELQTAITSYIPRPSDLKSLCLTCKQLRDVATPLLYHTVILDHDARKQGSTFFTYKHPGHAHVRRLFVRDTAQDEDLVSSIDSANRTISSALQYLPRDILRELRTPDTLTVDEETIVCLHKNQTKIEVLSIGPCIGYSEALRLACKETLKNVRVLLAGPSIVSENDFDIRRNILASRSQMDMLFVENCHLMGDWEDSAELRLLGDDRSEKTEFTLNKLFGGVKSRTKAGTHLQIHELWLHGLQLNVAYQLLYKKIDFLQIRTLALAYGAGSRSFIRSLTTLFKKNTPRLKAFHISDEVAVTTRAVAKDLEAFLTSFSGLAHLDMQIRSATKGLDLKCLSSHSTTLKHLGLRAMKIKAIDGEDHWAVSAEEMKAVATTCPHVQELMICLPEVLVDGFEKGQSNDCT